MPFGLRRFCSGIGSKKVLWSSTNFTLTLASPPLHFLPSVPRKMPPLSAVKPVSRTLSDTR